MCKPLFYSISYTINPWMVPGSENKSQAFLQWEKLVTTYLILGIKVNIIDQKMGSPDMVFATDQGVIQGKKVFMSSFRYRERQSERTPYFYHIDTALFVLNNRFVFYYPQAFSKTSQKILKQLKI